MNSPSLTLLQKKSLAGSFSPETVHVLALAVVAFGVVVPMMFWGVPSALDLSNHFRFALPFYDALRSGHLYPGWLAESNHGFGDASFRFYPPALYYLLAAARAISGNWYFATVLTFGVLSIVGAIGIYLWAREFTSSSTAMWAGIFYAIAPYHVNQLYQALLLAEFAAAAILPFAFLFVERVCRHRRARDIAGLAAVYALLVLTHLPLTVIGSIALALYAVLRLDRKRFWSTLGALTLSVVIGLAASACYWLTMVSELHWVRGETNPEPGLRYTENFVLSTLSPEYVSVWWMNILLLSMVAMFWPAILLASRTARSRFVDPQAHKSLTRGLSAVALILLLTLFMATPLSRPVWNLIHPLQETQFPWRWFVITSLAGSMLLALAVPFWSRLINTPKRPLAILACGTIAISLAFSIGHIIREARWLTPVQFDQTLKDIPSSKSVYQWLPIWVHEPLPQMSALVEAGVRTVQIETWEPEKRVFRITGGKGAEARLQTFFYPHWTATANGRQLSMRPDPHGAMLVSLPGEAAEVTVEFREPNRTRVASGFSLLGWLSIGGLLIRRRRQNNLAS
jgi:6-pyruvoyl-tetrahydropterin synthase-like protein